MRRREKTMGLIKKTHEHKEMIQAARADGGPAKGKLALLSNGPSAMDAKLQALEQRYNERVAEIAKKSEADTKKAIEANKGPNIARVTGLQKGFRVLLSIMLPKRNMIGMFDTMYKVQTIRPNGTVVLKPVKKL
jgi:hypothetical protein